MLLAAVAATSLAAAGYAPAGSSVSGAQARAADRSFSGNGGRSLPPFRVTTPSTLFWRAGGGIFQIFSAGLSNDGTVNSQAASGWTYMPPGSYRLQVNAIGAWQLRVTAGVVYPKKRGGVFTYSGNGGLQLPPFRSRATMLSWTCSGQIFQIFSSSGYGGGDVNSQAHRGSTYMSAGTHNLFVNADGNWTISWRS
jgi:hypothetical protein